MMLNDLLQAERLGFPVGHGQHIHAESVLKARFLIEHVLQVFDIRIFTKLQHDPDAFFGRLVGNVDNVGRLPRLDKCGHIVQEFSDIGPEHRVRYLGHDQQLFAALLFFDLDLAAKPQLACSGLVDREKIIFVYHDTASRKIRSLQISKKSFDRDIVILHISLDRIDHLAQIVGGDAGRHTDSDSVRSVYQQIGNTHRKDRRLLFRLIKVRHEVDHVFVQVCKKHFLRQFFEPCLGITHGGGPIAFDRTEVSVSVNQCTAFFKVLCHHHQRFVDRAVAVRMVFTHRVSDYPGTFSVRMVIAYAQLVHIIQCTSLHRLKPVPHVRKSPRYDNAHCVIDVGFLHHFRIVGPYDIFFLCFHRVPFIYVKL